MAEVEVCPVEELPPGSMKLVRSGSLDIGVYNCDGDLMAIEDRCSHDDGPLCEGDWEPDECIVVCPRHGSRFDLQTGIPMTLPAFEPVRTFPVQVRDDGMIVVRDARFDHRPGVPRNWHVGPQGVTTLFDNLSVGLPTIERFVVTTVKAHRHAVTDPRLAEDVRPNAGRETSAAAMWRSCESSACPRVQATSSRPSL